MKQISNGKQCETKDGAPKIYVMTNTIFKPPMHPRKKAKSFEDMSKNDQHQTPRAE